MHYLTEDKAKQALRDRGLPVPDGEIAASPREAGEVARRLGGAVAIKALVATGRRGKAGAIRFAGTPAEAEVAAAAILGQTVNGHFCRAVYVERRIEIEKELYLSLILEDYPPKLLCSAEGGVEIEEVHRTRPDSVISFDVDPVRGLPSWDAVAVWERAGVEGKVLAQLGKLTADAYAHFVAADCTMLELNPVGIDTSGRPVVVGTMMATDAEDGQPAAAEAAAGRLLTERERRVIEASQNLPGGMVRYTELDGDIGLFVGGGGAGLHQHDLILAAGGRPANHTDASTVNMDKVRVLIDAILDHPHVKSLFVSWHYQQMAQIDKRVIPVIEALKARAIDPRKFPVVIRMFGPGEELARQAAASLPGIHYMPHGAPLADGVKLIVELTQKVKSAEAVQ